MYFVQSFIVSSVEGSNTCIHSSFQLFASSCVDNCLPVALLVPYQNMKNWYGIDDSMLRQK
jgi:hypothetical protein